MFSYSDWATYLPDSKLGYLPEPMEFLCIFALKMGRKLMGKPWGNVGLRQFTQKHKRHVGLHNHNSPEVNSQIFPQLFQMGGKHKIGTKMHLWIEDSSRLGAI